jgi:hypothetical protein
MKYQLPLIEGHSARVASRDGNESTVVVQTNYGEVTTFVDHESHYVHLRDVPPSLDGREDEALQFLKGLSLVAAQRYECEHMAAASRDLYTALKSFEWVDIGGAFVCSRCRAPAPKGHVADCELDSVFRKAEGR